MFSKLLRIIYPHKILLIDNEEILIKRRCFKQLKLKIDELFTLASLMGKEVKFEKIIPSEIIRIDLGKYILDFKLQNSELTWLILCQKLDNPITSSTGSFIYGNYFINVKQQKDNFHEVVQKAIEVCLK